MEELEKSKPWEKPWTTDEIRRESGNWSLAGDAGLLNHLQQFSQNLLQRTHSTEVSLNKLIEELKTTSSEISNVTNCFLSLANTQFVENRVYDDDENETSPEDEKKEEEKAKPKAQQEAEVVARIKDALAKGMALLDSHFDAVDVPASDSEEDESSASTGRVFLEARNPYMMRPLPYLIGSKEFIEDDHVGLGDIQSDTEESPDQNLVHSSESDEDMEQSEFGAIPKRPRLSSSSMSENSEPESDRSGTLGKQKKHKLGNSHLGSADPLEEEPDMFGRESPPEADVGTVAQRGARNSFAAELASKLGGVAAESSMAQKQERDKSDNLFLPPSEPEEDNSLFGHNVGKFSGGLFDDLDSWRRTNNSLWGSKEEASNKKESEKGPGPGMGTDSLFNAGSTTDDLFGRDSKSQADEGDAFYAGIRSNQKSASAKVIRVVPSGDSPAQNVFTSTPTEVKPSQGLFDEVENTGLFKNDNLSNKTGMPQVSKSSSLFDGTDVDDGDLFSIPSSSKKDISTSQDTVKKIPVGGVSVKLFQSKLSPPVQQKSVDSSDDVLPESSRPAPVFGDSSSGIGSTGIGTFDSSNDVALFNPEFTSTKKSIHEEDGGDSLFGNKGLKAPISTGAVKPSMNLGAKARKPVSLFDDSDSGEDELLFSSTSSTSSRSRRSQGSGDLLATEKKPLQKKGVFDDENMLFGSSHQDDPGFDIFSGNSAIKNNNSGPKLVPEEKISHSVLFNDSTPKSKRVSHGLFDDFSDPSDDIFAIPPRTGDVAVEKPDDSAKKLLRNNLFSDDTDGAVDIFQVSVPKVSDNLRANVSASGEFNNSIYGGITDSISDSKDSGKSTDVTPFPHLESSKVSLFDDFEDSVEKEVKSESKSSNKPFISQKPKISMSKLSLFESSSEESDIFSISSKETNNQNKIQSDTGKSMKSVEETKNTKCLESQDDRSNHLLGKKTKEQEGVQNFQGDLLIRNKSEEVPQAPAAKPEPPRTLNIRKTTDMLFNDEEDLWTTGSLDEKVNGSVVDSSIGKGKVLSSDTLSAILQDYSTVSEQEVVADVPDSDTFSIRKKPTAVTDSPPKGPADAGSASPLKAKSLEPSPSAQSPRKIFIDPTALLPGAKPPSKTVNSGGGVSFDTPVDTNTVLHSAGKERAKIQVKRRPQSRRARREAIRISSMDLENNSSQTENKTEEIISKKKPYINNKSPHFEQKVQIETKPPLSKPEIALKPSQIEISEKELLKEKIDTSVKSGSDSPCDATSKLQTSDFLNGNSNPLSPSTDEEDFFAVPQEYGNTKEQPSDRENLFGGAPVLSPVDLPPRPTLFEDDADSHHISSSDLFSASSQPASLSKISPPVNTSEPKTDLFPGNKENSSPQSRAGDPLDKTSDSLEEDYDLFGSTGSTAPRNTQNIFEDKDIPEEDLFSEVKSIHSSVLKGDLSGKRITNLFPSTEDEPLFSGRETKEIKEYNSNTSGLTKNIEAVKDRAVLFSTSTSEDLFSVGNKTETTESSLPKLASNDLFPPGEPAKKSENYSSSIFSPVDREQKSLLLTENDDNLFSANISKEKDPKTDLFSSESLTPASKTNSGAESEAGLFSNKGWSGSTRRTSVAESNNLFGDDSPESDDLFSSTLITSKRKINSEVPKEGMSSKGCLFADNHDNIFDVTPGKSESKPSSSSVLQANHNLGISDEDSDLFSSSISSKKATIRTVKVSTSILQGQKKEELFEDPLMVIKK